MTTEPITRTEAVRLLLIAVLAVPPAFGWWEPSPAQFASLLGLYGAVSLALSVFARTQSTPTSSVALTTEQASTLKELGELAVDEQKRAAVGRRQVDHQGLARPD